MLSRDWILATLWELPLYCWPVFFWEVWWFERYYRAFRAANPVGMLGVSVLSNGRLVITLQAKGDGPDPMDWTRHAPRAPWARLDGEAVHDARLAALGLGHFGAGAHCTLTTPSLHRDCTPAEPLAPP